MNKDYLTSPLNDEYSKQLRELREKVINSPGMKIMLENQKEMKRWSALSPKINPEILAFDKSSSYKFMNRTIILSKTLESSLNQTTLKKLKKVGNSLLNPAISSRLIANSLSTEAYKTITESQRNQFKNKTELLEKTFNPVNVSELIADARGLPRKPYDSSLQDFINKSSEEAIFVDNKEPTPHSIKHTHDEIVNEPIVKPDTPISNQDIYDLFTSLKYEVEQININVNQSNVSPSKKEQMRYDAKNIILSSAAELIIQLIFNINPILAFYLMTIAYVMINKLFQD